MKEYKNKPKFWKQIALNKKPKKQTPSKPMGAQHIKSCITIYIYIYKRKF